MTEFIVLSRVDILTLCDDKPVTVYVDKKPYVFCTDEYFEKQRNESQESEEKMEDYKILTPGFREEINKGFDSTIEQLRECTPNALVIAQIEGLKMWKRYIDGLPDGVPIPVRK